MYYSLHIQLSMIDPLWQSLSKDPICFTTTGPIFHKPGQSCIKLGLGSLSHINGFEFIWYERHCVNTIWFDITVFARAHFVVTIYNTFCFAPPPLWRYIQINPRSFKNMIHIHILQSCFCLPLKVSRTVFCRILHQKQDGQLCQT